MPDSTPVQFLFGDKPIRILFDADRQPWWSAVDVCDVLGIADVYKAMGRLDPGDVGLRDMKGSLAMNEVGLCRLIFRSHKPEAKALQTWLFQEVFPHIRHDATQTRADPPKLLPVSHSLRDAITCDVNGKIGIGASRPAEEYLSPMNGLASTTAPAWTVPPTHTLTFEAPDGRQAYLDFSDGRVVYSGDLAVEDSARLFFDALAFFRQTECGKAQP